MSTIVVLFNLKEGVNQYDYESWAKTVDIPTVNALPSVSYFSVNRARNLLMSDATPPYQYVETIVVEDEEAFFESLGTKKMQAVAAEFGAFAETPIFTMMDDII
jgi:hypothetical protein